MKAKQKLGLYNPEEKQLSAQIYDFQYAALNIKLAKAQHALCSLHGRGMSGAEGTGGASPLHPSVTCLAAAMVN